MPAEQLVLQGKQTQPEPQKWSASFSPEGVMPLSKVVAETFFTFHLPACPLSSFYPPHLPSVLLYPIMMTMTCCQGAMVCATTLWICAGEAGSWSRATAWAKVVFKQRNLVAALWSLWSPVPVVTPPHLNDFPSCLQLRLPLQSDLVIRELWLKQRGEGDF